MNERIFCVSCREPLTYIELNGTWGMCTNKDCSRVGLLSGISLKVKTKDAKDSKKPNK